MAARGGRNKEPLKKGRVHNKGDSNTTTDMGTRDTFNHQNRGPHDKTSTVTSITRHMDQQNSPTIKGEHEHMSGWEEKEVWKTILKMVDIKLETAVQIHKKTTTIKKTYPNYPQEKN